MTSDFPLWMFYDSQRLVITRGRSQEEAFVHASKSWQRGQTVTFANFLPIKAAACYGLNHSPGWLNRAPEWLART